MMRFARMRACVCSSFNIIYHSFRLRNPNNAENTIPTLFLQWFRSKIKWQAICIEN